MSQLSFGFEVPLGHVEPEVSRMRPQSRKKPAPQKLPEPSGQALSVSAREMLSRTTLGDANQKDVDHMARALEGHPDYKVLRRLVPCLDYGPASPGAVNGAY